MPRVRNQLSLFEPQPSSFPDGFRYCADLLSAAEEQELVEKIAVLPFEEFQFHGFVGKRRVVSFGRQYDFNQRELRRAEDIPAFLLPLRDKAAGFGEIPASELQQVLVTEYSPGAAIGARCDDSGCVYVDKHQRTSVEGLYAAGDVVSDLDQIVVATGHAAVAATAIHNSLPRNFR